MAPFPDRANAADSQVKGLTRIMDQVRPGRQPEKGWRRWSIRLTGPVPFAVCSALALLASFPPVNLGPVAWVAIAPLAASLDRPSLPFLRALAAGWAFGLVYWGAQFSWLGYTLAGQGGVSPGATLVFSASVWAALAALPAVSFVAVTAARRGGFPSSLTLPVLFGAMDWLLGAWPFGGVAWGSLAGPQAATLAAGVLLPLVGGPGLAAAVAGVGTAWASLAQLLLARPSRRAWAAAALLAAATAGLNWPLNGDPWSGGATAGAGAIAAPGELHALLVPGQLTLRGMHASEGTAASLQYYLTRTLTAFAEPDAGPLAKASSRPSRTGQVPFARRGSASGGPHGSAFGGPRTSARPARPARPAARPADPNGASPRTLVIWPESAALQPLDRGHSLVELSQLGSVLDADFLVGSDANDPGRPTNSLFLVTGDRFDFMRYDKRHLVPFGEYVPAGFRWLFGPKVTAGDQDYSPGTQPPVLVWRSPREGGATLGLAICFESILPRHAADAVRSGAEVLVVAANDAWLPRYAVEQHIQLSALQGREVGRDVLFVSNGGPALHIAAGHVQARSEVAPLFVTALRHARLTPWVRWGQWSLLGAAGAVLALGAVRRNAHWGRGRN